MGDTIQIKKAMLRGLREHLTIGPGRPPCGIDLSMERVTVWLASTAPAPVSFPHSRWMDDVKDEWIW